MSTNRILVDMSVRLFVGGLPLDASSQQVATFLWDWVVPDAANVVMDRSTGRGKGFGSATVSTPEDAFIACRADGGVMDGRRITITIASPILLGQRFPSLRDQIEAAREAPSADLDRQSFESELLKTLDDESMRELWLRDSLLNSNENSEGRQGGMSGTVKSKMTMLVRSLADNPEWITELHPRLFEHVIASLLSASGYREIRLTIPSADGGVDIYASKNSGLGKSLYLLQCKRYSPRKKVTRPDVQLVYGVLASTTATRGALVTTSTFTKPAEEFLADHSHHISGINGPDLQNWLLATAQILPRD